jgi:hypothetical protein
MTAAEMLNYMKKDVFAPMGIDIESVQILEEGKRKDAVVSVADQLLGIDAKGDFAQQLASSFFDSELRPVKKNPLMQEPQEGLAGWIVDLMRLLAYLLENDPFTHPINLNLLDDKFPQMSDDGTKQFSPSNKKLLEFLPAYSRVGALLANMVYYVACIEAQKMDLALYDMYATKCYQRQRRLDFTDTGNCFGYIDCLKDAISDADVHLTEGRKLDLTIEEIALVDSLWTEVPHHYPENCVVAAREVWQKIKPIRDGFGDGRKSKEDCDCFTKDMLEIILPIAEKHDVDMELDDEHSLPLEYVKNWLSGIYYGNDPVFG